MNPRQRIRVLLLDADGVVQRADAVWRTEMAALVGPGVDLDRFGADVFAAERPCLRGEADFATELQRVLQRWGSPRTIGEALSTWRKLIVHHDVIDAVQRLRGNDVLCCLASNQQAVRVAYMDNELGYARLFDQRFYSCELGHAKPDHAFFERIVATLGIPPDQMVFVDDLGANADAARQVGMHGVHFPANAGAGQLLELLKPFGIEIHEELQ